MPGNYREICSLDSGWKRHCHTHHPNDMPIKIYIPYLYLKQSLEHRFSKVFGCIQTSFWVFLGEEFVLEMT